MSSGPEYFYTIELPEARGRMLEKLASFTPYDAEEYAARLLCDALERAEIEHEAHMADELSEIRKQQQREIAANRVDHGDKPNNNDLDDGIPF